MRTTITEGIWREITPGHWDRVGEAVYNVTIIDGQLNVNGRSLPIMYKHGLSFKLLKTRIYSVLTPDKFFDEFFKKDTGWGEMICKHVLQHGKPANPV